MDPGYRSDNALGYQQITSLTTATALTVPPKTQMCLITVEGQAVRYRDDGVNPTATVGMPLAVAASLRYTAGQMAQLRFIEQAVGGIINIVYYG